MRKARIAVIYWCVIGFGGFSIVLRAMLGRDVSWFLPTDILGFLAPVIFLSFSALADRIDRHRYNHIVECHPLFARLVWQPDLGPRPLGGYRRRCLRRWCFLRSL